MANNQRKVRNEKNAWRPKSGAAKVTNVSKIAKRLKDRMAKEGETAWLKDAWARLSLRAKKYGVTI